MTKKWLSALRRRTIAEADCPLSGERNLTSTQSPQQESRQRRSRSFELPRSSAHSRQNKAASTIDLTYYRLKEADSTVRKNDAKLTVTAGEVTGGPSTGLYSSKAPISTSPASEAQLKPDLTYYGLPRTQVSTVGKDEPRVSEKVVEPVAHQRNNSMMDSGTLEKLSWRDRICGKKLSHVSSNAGSTGDSGSAKQKPEHGSDLGHGEIVPASITHKKVNWIQATLILIAETVSLGILSLPASVADMGLVVGALAITIFGLCTLATGFMLYYFRMRYPHVQGFGQAGYVLAGRPGQWIAEVLFQLLLIFIMAAHILTFGTMANTVAGNSWKCTVVFKFIGFIVSLACTLPRTFKSNSYLSAISCLSVLTATIIALVDIAIIGEGQGTADVGPPSSGVAAADWMMSLSNVLVSFTGHLAYFQVMAEMDKPEDFRKSLIATNVTMSSLYMVVAIVIYYYAGPGVGSPALSSAAPLFAKLSYGIATPTIVVAGVIAGLLACKRIQAWFWESVKQEAKAADEISLRSWSSWVGIVFVLWALAFLLANVLPYFSPLLALIGAISGTWITLGIPAMTCMYMCHHGFARTEVEFDAAGADDTAAKSLELMAREQASSSWRWWHIFTPPKHAPRNVRWVWAAAVLLFLLNCVMIGFGGYGSIQTMVTLSADNYAPFSCSSSS